MASGIDITDQCTRDEIAVLTFMHNCPEFIAMVGGRAKDVTTQKQLDKMGKCLMQLRMTKDYVIAHDKGSELEFNVGKVAQAIEEWHDYVRISNDPDGHSFCIFLF